MQNLNAAIAQHDRLRQELLERWPDLINDEETLNDSLEGASTLPDVTAQIIRSALEDERLAGGISEHIVKLQLRKKRLEERSARKRSLALYAMQEGDLPRITQPDFSASVSTSKGRVIITDEEALALEFIRLKREPDKKLIGEKLRQGDLIDGATLSNPEPILTVRS